MVPALTPLMTSHSRFSFTLYLGSQLRIGRCLNSRDLSRDPEHLITCISMQVWLEQSPYGLIAGSSLFDIVPAQFSLGEHTGLKCRCRNESTQVLLDELY